MVGINNATVITMDNISYIANSSGIAELAVNINHIVFADLLFFLLLITLWIILFIGLQRKDDNILHNLMYSGAAVSILSFFVRAVEIMVHGAKKGLITDKMLWTFPLITIFIAWILWMTKE